MSVFLFRRGTAILPKMAIPVTITGSSSAINGGVKINDTNYYSATTGIEAYVGDTIICTISGSSRKKGKVTIDGTVVCESYGSDTYNYIIPNDISAITIQLYGNLFGVTFLEITITTS